MSLARLSAGAGYQYLLRHTACGDIERDAATPLTAYYTAAGYPPGRWLGAGLAGLDGGAGLAAATVVSEEAMAALYGSGRDPVTGTPLGKAYPSYRPVEQRIAQAVARLPETLPEDERAARAAQIEQIERSRPVRAAVAGFDLTFTVAKSGSVLWALGDPATQRAVAEAHREAVDAALAVLGERALFTRVGARSVAQVPTRGMIAAAFDHWDTRTGDPNLHTHVVIANKVQGQDGVWRSLDSRALHHAAVAISELYDDFLADALAARLPVSWGWRPRGQRRTPAFEIDGLPDRLLAGFSTRTVQVEAYLREALADFHAAHGRAPTRVEVLRLRQRATRASRPPKSPHPLTELLTRWRQTAARLTGRSPEQITAEALRRRPRQRLRAAQLGPDLMEALTDATLAAVSERRSTWTRSNLLAEAARASRALRMRTPAERLTLVDRIVDASVARCVPLDPPELFTVPEKFRRPDGSSVFTRPAEHAFTTGAMLAAEDRLLAAAEATGAPALPAEAVRAGRRLTPDQRAALAAVATSGLLLDVLVGPAGAGKTRTLRALRHAWEAAFGAGSVVGLAPSATAADELSEALGTGCENTAKWLYESTGPGGQRRHAVAAELAARRTGHPVADRRIDQALKDLRAEQTRWTLRPGQLLIVDEASMGATHALDQLVAHAGDAGAKALLVGDHHQLGAVDAGGAFRLLADTGTPATLKALWRFRYRWEANATRRLRAGDPAALDPYQEHGRLHDGPAESMLDAAYTAWRADQAQGRSALLIAADRHTVTALNQRAHDDRVTAEQVDPGGIDLDDGVVVGRGDLVVTRHNDRRLRLPSGGHVRNGALWRVTAAYPDGSLDVTPLPRRAAAATVPAAAAMRLPAGYVREHVELGYATTVHRAQGMTVEHSHVLVAPGMTRQGLYVAMTRGRAGNHAYVATDAVDPACPHPIEDGDAPTGRQVLERALATDGGELSATATLRTRQDEATALTRLVPIRTTLIAAATRERWEQLLPAAGLDPATVAVIMRSPTAGALSAALDGAADAGHDPLRVLAVAAHLPLDDPRQSAGDLAAVLHARVRRWLDHAPPAETDGHDVPPAAAHAHEPTDPQYATAISEIDRLIHHRVDTLRQHPEDDDHRRRLLAFRIAETTRGITPSPLSPP